jgi:hypothetical protein
VKELAIEYYRSFLWYSLFSGCSHLVGHRIEKVYDLKNERMFYSILVKIYLAEYIVQIPPQ